MNRLTRCLALPLMLACGSPLPAGTTPKATPKAKTKPVPPAVAKTVDEAYAELQKKNYAAALPLYEKALALTPGRPELWNEYAICLRNLRRLPAATRAGWRAIQLDGGKTVPLWNAQANTFMEAREWKAAQACTGADVKDSALSFQKGQALAEQQKDMQRADYAGQLLVKVKAGESIWPPIEPGQAWQSLPTDLLTLPKRDASRLPLPAQVDHRYTLTEGNVLSLSLPEAWTETFDPTRPEHLFAIRYAVVGQEGFKAFLHPIKGVGNPLGVWGSANDAVKRLQGISAETDLKPQLLTSTTATGYWILSTDKKSADKEPAKGEYRHLLTVLFDVKSPQCVGTVLTNSKAPEVIEPCLAAFGSARKIEPAAKN